MAREFDLLGHPIADNHGKPGANGHVPDAESTNKVRVLLSAGLPKKRIAEELGVTMPTLTKHYFHSGRIKVRMAREFALAETRAKMVTVLDKAASAGNVTAAKALLGIVSEEEMALRVADAAGDHAPAKKAATTPKGKKELQSAEASAALENDSLLNPEYTH